MINMMDKLEGIACCALGSPHITVPGMRGLPCQIVTFFPSKRQGITGTLPKLCGNCARPHWPFGEPDNSDQPAFVAVNSV